MVYDGVGKSTLEGSLKCLATRGMMVSFGNASGPLSPIDVPKLLLPKGLYFIRPSMQQYLSSREEIDEASEVLFEKIDTGKINIEITKNNDYIVIKLTDNGTGILDTKKVMTPYFTTKKKGSGLGLPIVSKIINEHSGEFVISNNKKGGITIIISLPFKS